jgi:hypothetical protein
LSFWCWCVFQSDNSLKIREKAAVDIAAGAAAIAAEDAVNASLVMRMRKRRNDKDEKAEGGCPYV